MQHQHNSCYCYYGMLSFVLLELFQVCTCCIYCLICLCTHHHECCSICVAPYSICIARYVLLDMCCSICVARYVLLDMCCSICVAPYVLLHMYCSICVARYALHVTISVTRYALSTCHLMCCSRCSTYVLVVRIA